MCEGFKKCSETCQFRLSGDFPVRGALGNGCKRVRLRARTLRAGRQKGEAWALTCGDLALDILQVRSSFEPLPTVATASASTVASLVASQVSLGAARVAVESRFGSAGSVTRSYAELDERSRRLATALLALGAVRGSRVALLSENRAEYVEVVVAAAHIGAVVACQNWRLTAGEIAACVELVGPTLAFVSPTHLDKREALALPEAQVIAFGAPFERLIAEHSPYHGDSGVVPEDPLLLLYTSG